MGLKRIHYDVGIIDLVKEGYNRSAVWDTIDYNRVQHEFATIRNAGFMARVGIKIKDKLMYQEYHQLELRLLRAWEENIDRIHNDKKAGTVFSNGAKFEPAITVSVRNKVLWDGTRLYNMFCVGQSTDYFEFMAIGDDRTATDLSMQKLVSEKARANLNIDGLHTADGNVIKYAVQFGPGVQDMIVREIGGFNDPNEGDAAYRATLPDDTLEQRQGDTFITMNHNIVTSPR